MGENNKMERAATENERFVNKVMKSIKENFLNSKSHQLFARQAITRLISYLFV